VIARDIEIVLVSAVVGPMEGVGDGFSEGPAVGLGKTPLIVGLPTESPLLEDLDEPHDPKRHAPAMPPDPSPPPLPIVRAATVATARVIIRAAAT